MDAETFREAARQLREEADLLANGEDHGGEGAYHLLSMARRFENEAKAAEEAKGETT